MVEVFTGIERPRTDLEKNDFKPLADETPHAIAVFQKKINVKLMEYNKKFKPFCQRCARLDFIDWIDRHQKEMNRNEGFIDFEKLKFQLPELEEYGNEERFEFIKETDAMEPTTKAMPGAIQRQIKIGIHRDYKCKTRNCGISIFISNEDLEKLKLNSNK